MTPSNAQRRHRPASLEREAERQARRLARKDRSTVGFSCSPPAHGLAYATVSDRALSPGPAARSPSLVGRAQPKWHCRGAIQTSASINPGNSDGALVNASGQVIGIPALAAASPQGGSLARSIGFVTPFSLARDITRQIIASGRVNTSRRAAPGALIATLTGPGRRADRIAIVVVVTGGSLAGKGGLRADDVIKPTGNAHRDVPALSGVLAAASPDSRSPSPSPAAART